MSRTTVRPREVLILLSFFVVTTSHHRCSVANMVWDPLTSVGRMLTILGFWLAAQTVLTFILHVSLQVHRKAGLDVHDISLSSVIANVLGYEVSPACYSGPGKRIARIRSVVWTVSSRLPGSGRAMELVNGHESFLALTIPGALSINP